MKKLLLASAVAAVAVGGYYYSSGSNVPSDPLFSLIPADSPLVVVQTEAYDHFEYVNAMGASEESLYDLFTGIELTPEQDFLVAYLEGYIQSATDKQALKAYLGAPDKVKPVFYTLGMIPVYKIELENTDAFWNTIDKTEQETGASHQLGKQDDIEYRRYKLSHEDAEDIGLVIAVDGNIATFTLDVPLFQDINPLKLALGIDKPQKAFADSNILTALKSKYGKQYTAYGYLDHQEVVKGFTQPASNLLAQQIDRLQQLSPEPFIEEIRQPSCQSELATIAGHWPRTVSFARYLAQDGQASVDGKVVVESHNRVILNALKSIRGFMPQMTAQDSIFEVGFGLDVEKLAPAINMIWQDLQQPTYQCEWLSEIQQDMGEDNPSMMLSLGASMVNGMKGMHFTLNDMTLDTQNPFALQFEKLDFLFTLSAENPAVLLQTAQMFIPQLSQLALQPNGDAVDLSALIESETGISAPLSARLNDKHLALYSGERSETNSQRVLASPLTAKGLFQFSVNAPRVLELMEQVSDMTGESVPEDLSAGLGGNAVTQVIFDVNDHGFIFGYEHHVKTQK
ncbi:hypothetical protein [Vibrio cincinnatiensis]|uniref:hypothetical protein n=1 Tax=Vibrio cincinnatiensis TaxID=675 RepID=UPI001EDEECDF|nr:hypothetical protein [Vibrio cincinnatiensis]MCG3724366.1 hypothetical protein [Vibrio cincinnatiensis]